MPWVDKLSAPQELKRRIRDLVALSTLPTEWINYDLRQIGDSIAASLLAMLDADVVQVTMPGLQDESAVVIMNTSHAMTVGATLLIESVFTEACLARRDDVSIVPNPFGEKPLRIMMTPIDFGDYAAAIVAASSNSEFPSDTHRLLLGIAASSAAAAIRRWHAEAEQRRLVALVERSSEIVGFADMDGAPRYLNTAGFELLGLSGIEEARRFSIFDFIAPEDRARAHRELMPQIIETGRWLGELNLRHFKTGEIIPCFVDWFRIDDPRTGRPMNIAAISRDLRSQNKLESDLRGLNETFERRVVERTSELAEAIIELTFESDERQRADARAQELQMELYHTSRLSAAGQMAAALAHELSQPLTAVTNSINAGRRMLAKGAHREREIILEILGEAADQALRAGEIIRRLREFVTRGETEMRLESLSALIRQASTLASAGTEANGVQVLLRFDPHAEIVLGNRIQLQQVIVNLMRNAYEAMAHSERRELLVTTARLDDGLIQIMVADRGTGVSDEVAEQLFEPFSTTKRDGMGLGLSICRSIVEAHGGKLWHRPNDGGGAAFHLSLPSALTTEINDVK